VQPRARRRTAWEGLPPRPRPRERAGDRTRARLFEASLAEFRRVGVEAASIARIAGRAGVSRSAFYFHFPTKEHVLLELQWSLERETVERLARCRGLREVLKEFVETMVDAERRLESSGLLRDILILYARRPAGVDLGDQPLPLVKALGQHFAAGARRGELRPDLEPERANRLCLASVFGYLIAAGAGGPDQRADLLSLVSTYLAPSASRRGGARRSRATGAAGGAP